ncbi:MAG: ADP-glyceromanno-heptose 6-epimerase [Deltaproteobacteria bacterium]|nr:ADP-glyceromanno-heptose 6-epimerase [Deltaproteobacteria bacterium]
MILVTGGAGFIGSNLVQALNAEGETRLLVVDRLGNNFRNLCDLRFIDFMQPEELKQAIEHRTLPALNAIFHQGACADTTCQDGRYMMENNFSFSKSLLHFALERKIPFVYASSASVYGSNLVSEPSPGYERPLNLYALSKLAFDNHVRSAITAAESTIVGLRYFNVYGPRERHKGRMASMVFQLYHQLSESQRARLFEANGGYADGEQRRDFVFVGDVVRLNLFFARRAEVTRGIFNAGTGNSRSFNEVARTLIAYLGYGEIEYVPFPAELTGKYQNFTQADVAPLRNAGWQEPFTSLEDGIAQSVRLWAAEA